jgi:KipI family sensor histidine kinase inhibitor
MTRSVPVGEVRLLGDRALLIGVADSAAARALTRALREGLAEAGDLQVVPSFATVAVLLGDDSGDLEAVRAVALRVVAASGRDRVEREEVPGRLLTLPCVFDGPDLPEVAALAGCPTEQVVARLTERPLTVAVMGFSPGFAYLDGLPESLRAVPRRDRPRPLVAAGSVALANGHAAVYPTASPGGWQLVGRTGVTLFAPDAPPYAVLAPGDRAHLTVARAGDRAEPAAVPAPVWSAPPDARLVLEVVTPGLRAVVQDGGRHGMAAVGVPRAGPADPVSFTLANRLVGNTGDAGALELTGDGARLHCRAAAYIAVVGAAADARVDGTAVPGAQVVPLAAGQQLQVGPIRRGCRTYLSVAGSILGPTVFWSSASDELSGLGAGPLAPGALLHAGPWSPPLGDHLGVGAASEVEPGHPLELRVVAGPHPEWFGPAALARLAGVVFRLADHSNRVGLRLQPESDSSSLRRGGAAGELDSQGVVTGAVQVPPDGDPVILMPDHATLGGYPVLAVVVSADHGLLGQCAPGTRVRFVPVGQDEATAARRARRRALDGAVVGHYPLTAG